MRNKDVLRCIYDQIPLKNYRTRHAFIYVTKYHRRVLDDRDPLMRAYKETRCFPQSAKSIAKCASYIIWLQDAPLLKVFCNTFAQPSMLEGLVIITIKYGTPEQLHYLLFEFAGETESWSDLFWRQLYNNAIRRHRSTMLPVLDKKLDFDYNVHPHLLVPALDHGQFQWYKKHAIAVGWEDQLRDGVRYGNPISLVMVLEMIASREASQPPPPRPLLPEDLLSNVMWARDFAVYSVQERLITKELYRLLRKRYPHLPRNYVFEQLAYGQRFNWGRVISVIVMIFITLLLDGYFYESV